MVSQPSNSKNLRAQTILMPIFLGDNPNPNIHLTDAVKHQVGYLVNSIMVSLDQCPLVHMAKAGTPKAEKRMAMSLVIPSGSTLSESIATFEGGSTRLTSNNG